MFWLNRVISKATGCEHFNFQRGHRYQLGVTWDKPRHDYRFYVNDVLIATSNQFAESLEHHPCVDTLYLGNPCLAFADLAFHDQVIVPAVQDNAVTAGLKRIFTGAAPRRFEWQPTGEWVLQFEASLTKPPHLDSFYVQGNTGAPSITPDGLLIHTPMEGGDDPANDREQVYRWTKQNFEGDLVTGESLMPSRTREIARLTIGRKKESRLTSCQRSRSSARTSES